MNCFTATSADGGKTGAAGRNRTHDPLVRSQVLYPAELQPQNFQDYNRQRTNLIARPVISILPYCFYCTPIDFHRPANSGAAGRNRTHDPLVRSQVLYPAELQPQFFAIFLQSSESAFYSISFGLESWIFYPPSRSLLAPPSRPFRAGSCRLPCLPSAAACYVCCERSKIIGAARAVVQSKMQGPETAVARPHSGGPAGSILRPGAPPLVYDAPSLLSV